jgi:hypothetical protein
LTRHTSNDATKPTSKENTKRILVVSQAVGQGGEGGGGSFEKLDALAKGSRANFEPGWGGEKVATEKREEEICAPGPVFIYLAVCDFD